MDAKSAAAKPFVRATAAGSTLNVLGVTHVYKATGAETGNSFSLWEAMFPPGRGAPPHTHTREDEAFYVLSGEVLMEVEGQAERLHLGPGAFLFAPRHLRHGYRNPGKVDAHLLVFAMPGAGLDRMFAEFDEAGKRAGHMPPISAIAAIAARHGVAIHSPE